MGPLIVPAANVLAADTGKDGGWFEQGVDTPGTVLIKVQANRIRYRDGEDAGEVEP